MDALMHKQLKKIFEMHIERNNMKKVTINTQKKFSLEA